MEYFVLKHVDDTDSPGSTPIWHWYLSERFTGLSNRHTLLEAHCLDLHGICVTNTNHGKLDIIEWHDACFTEWRHDSHCGAHQNRPQHDAKQTPKHGKCKPLPYRAPTWAAFGRRSLRCRCGALTNPNDTVVTA
jgi:hypothetical protein